MSNWLPTYCINMRQHRLLACLATEWMLLLELLPIISGSTGAIDSVYYHSISLSLSRCAAFSSYLVPGRQITDIAQRHFSRQKSTSRGGHLAPSSYKAQAVFTSHGRVNSPPAGPHPKRFHYFSPHSQFPLIQNTKLTKHPYFRNILPVIDLSLYAVFGMYLVIDFLIIITIYIIHST